LGFIGAGNMSTALVRGLVAQGMVEPDRIWVSSPSGPRKPIAEVGVRCTRDNATVAANADVLILAVKPYMMAAALDSMRGEIRPSTLVVSVAAGCSISQLSSMLSSGGGPSGWRIVRVMPNTPAAIGQGAAAMCLGALATPADADVVTRLFSAVGTVEVVSEAMMDGA
jgi:pyrroline-5-carboxylate reductase